MMQTLRIPGTHLDVSVLCYGASSFGTDVSGADLDRLVSTFLEAGGNFFDTAHVYAVWVPNGVGASERELGAVLRRLGVLDRTVIASKGGHPDLGASYRRPPDFLSEKVLLADIAESRERLGVETIDLYFLHRDDGKTPVADIVESLNAQIRAGAIRHFGASNWSVERMAEANAYAESKGLQGFVISQVQWSLAQPNWVPTPTEPTTRFVTDTELAWHQKSRVPIACYSATASGYFAGNTKSHGLYENPTSRGRLERATVLAEELGCTANQIAFAYLLHQPVTAIPLFSTIRPEHLTEILGSVEIKLTLEQVAWLRDGD